MKILPDILNQNPAPFEKNSQDRMQKIDDLVNLMLEAYRSVLPSNYASEVDGPWYYTQFRTALTKLAEFQISAEEVLQDDTYQYTRSEVLWQILGEVVFPEAAEKGFPELNGDLTFRDFLKNMVVLLLKGSTKETITQGLELLTDATITVLERSGVTKKDAFTFDIDVSSSRTVFYGSLPVDISDFPADSMAFMANAAIVLEALKPAHLLYNLRFVFTETIDKYEDTLQSMGLNTYHYEDYRKNWRGVKEYQGTQGITPDDHLLLIDSTRDFTRIRSGAALSISSGVNRGEYIVDSTEYFPYGDDTTPRAYTTYPTLLTGLATVSESTIIDSSQDFGAATYDETLTFAAGPNAGTYIIKTLEGLDGGPVGEAVGPATAIRVAPSILKLTTRMLSNAVSQEYVVEVDRLGVQMPIAVVGE